MKLDRNAWVGAWMTVALQLALAPPALAKFEVPPPVQVVPVAAVIQSVGFSKVVFDLKPGQPYGELQVGILCLPKETLTWEGGRSVGGDDFNAAFAREMKAGGVKVVGDPDDLFSTPGESAQYLIAADVKDLGARFCFQFADLHSYAFAKGGVVARVEWQVYSSLERKVVARIVTVAGSKGTGSASGSEIRNILEAFRQNVRALINSSEFRQIVTAAPPAPGPTRPSGGAAILRIAEAAAAPSVPDAVGSVVAIFAGGGFGSGFVIDDGYLITNSHVVGEASAVRVRWPDGLETTGQVVRSDRRRDVALVKADTRGRPALGLRTAAVRPSDTVFAIGTPLDPTFQNTLTKGVVSAMRTIDGFLFIQSDVMVNHGNSGGPLLDETGKVVGITAAGYQPDGAPSGINLFIPIRDALDFLGLQVAGASAPTVARAPIQLAPAPPSPVDLPVQPASAAPAPTAEGDAPITDVEAWIGRNVVDRTGWLYVGADRRAAYFGREGGVATLSDGVLEGTFRAELFRPERAGGSVIYSERSVWQLNCSTGQVREIAITAFDSRNLQGAGTAANLPQAVWQAPPPDSVASGVAKEVCGELAARQAGKARR